MTKTEKFELAILQGFTYEKETNRLFGKKNRLITSKHRDNIVIQLKAGDKYYQLNGAKFAWYFLYKEMPMKIIYKDGLLDLKIMKRLYKK